jgi:uncharacterized protein YbaP (TraB family)
MSQEQVQNISDDEFVDLGTINLGTTLKTILSKTENVSEDFKNKATSILEACQVNNAQVKEEISNCSAYKELVSKLGSNDLNQLVSIGILVLAAGNKQANSIEPETLLTAFKEADTLAVENSELKKKL